MKYEMKGKVRYSEIGEDGCLTLYGIINYFQDCCIFIPEEAGRGVGYAQTKNRGWVLSGWQIVILRRPALAEAIVVRTWPYDFKGFLGSRNFTMETEAGERLAYANSLWSFVDMATGTPIKITEPDIAGYEIEERLEMDYAPRKIRLPEELRPGKAFPVCHFHVDTNRHVNNGQYIQMAMEYLPEDFSIGQLRAEYKKPAHLGEQIYPRVALEGDRAVAVLQNEAGETYCVVEFTKQG